MVGVVGGDFGAEEEQVFARHNIDTSDLERIADGKTFRWYGRYEYDLNVAHTLDTQLNVFAGFQPKLSQASKTSRLLFLGNIQPDLQRGVREQMAHAELVALDTMNLWIETTRDSLQKTIEVVDLMIINDAEARQLTSEPNLIKAARKILSWGPHTLIVNGLSREPGKTGRACPAPRDDFWIGNGLIQRRRIRHWARAAPDPR